MARQAASLSSNLEMALRATLRPLRQSAGLARFMSSKAHEDALLNTPETRVTTLKNGFRVATEQTPHKTATVGIYIGAGSRFENDKNNGTAHFLEHMAFKGTTKRSQHQLEVEVENMGAHLNAYTSRENTAYYAKCLSSDVGKATEILSDILQNSVLDEKHIERERDVIIREMQEVNEIPEEVVFDYLHATAYQGSDLSRTILGPEENIKSITRDDLQSYIKTNYTAPRMVLAAAGGIEHDALVEIADKLFGNLPNTVNSPTETKPSVFHGSLLNYRDDSKPTANFAIAVEGVGWTHTDYFPLMVANSIVGSWDRTFAGGQNLSSPLARIVTEHKLALNYMSFNTSYTDTGLWGIYASAERENVEDLTFAFTQEWMRLSTSATDSEVERAKNQLKASMLFSLDGTSPICDEIGRQMLTYGRRMSPIELNARISAVTAASVRDAVSRYVADRCPAVAAVGPTEGFPDYNRLRSNLVWFRT